MDEKKRMEFVERIGSEIAAKISVRACEWHVACELCEDVIDNIHCSPKEIASVMINAQRNAQCGGHNFKIFSVVRGQGDKFVGWLKGLEFVPFNNK